MHNNLPLVLDKYYTGLPHDHLKSFNSNEGLTPLVYPSNSQVASMPAGDLTWIRCPPTSTTSSKPRPW